MGGRERLAQRIGDRVQRQQPQGTGGERPSLGAAGGQVQRLGGNPIPDRRFQGSGAVPVGGAVQSNQGISTGAPAGQEPEWFQAGPDLNVALLVSGVPTIENARPRTDVDFAINTESGALYRWDNQQGADGAWLFVSGVVEQIDVVIDEPTDREYLITVSQRYPVRIAGIQTNASFSATVAPAVGEDVAIGGQIALTLSGVGSPDPVAFSIELERLG
jgi:hypothetical protein